MTPEDATWTNPFDKKEYQVGDLISAYTFDTSGALVHGEPCVFLCDPGFAGVVAVKTAHGVEEVEHHHSIPDDAILKWLIQPIEPDPNVWYVGPESPGWRWFYARRSTLTSHAMMTSQGNDMTA